MDQLTQRDTQAGFTVHRWCCFRIKSFTGIPQNQGQDEEGLRKTVPGDWSAASAKQG